MKPHENDQPADASDLASDLPADVEEQVRRALADARVTDPIPADVAARLEATLAGLGADRDEQAVSDLDARRAARTHSPARRRRLGPLVAAAAAVVAVGVGVPAMLAGQNEAADNGTASDSAAMPQPDAADSDAGGRAEAEDAPAEEALPESGSRVDPAPSGEALSLPVTPSLTSDGLRRQLVEQRGGLRAKAADAGAQQDGEDREDGDDPEGTASYALCGAADDVAGATPARLDGAEVFVVFGAVDGDRQAVRVYSCADGSRLARTQVPYP